MKSKIFQKKEDNKASDFERDISLKDAKSLKVELSSFVIISILIQMNMRSRKYL